MRVSLRYSIEIVLQLLFSVLFLGVQLIDNGQTVGRWLFVANTAIFNFVVLIELYRIFVNLTVRELPFVPRRFLGLMLLIVSLLITFANIATSIGVFDPQRYFTGIDDPNESPYVVWLRMNYLIAILVSSGGYGRYIPSHIGSEVLMSYVNFVKMTVFLLFLAALIKNIARRYNRAPDRRISKTESQHEFIHEVVAHEGNTTIVLVIEIVILVILSCIAVGISEVGEGLVGHILMCVFTGIGFAIFFYELSLIVMSVYTNIEEFQREATPLVSMILFIALMMQVYAMFLTSFALFHPSKFFANLPDSTDPFLIYAIMLTASVTFVVPGGFGHESPQSFALELGFTPLAWIWIFMFVTVLTVVPENIIGSANTQRSRTKSRIRVIPQT